MRCQVPNPLVENVDDVAFGAVRQTGGERLHEQHRGAQICVQMRSPRFRRRAAERVLLKNRRVVDQARDGPKSPGDAGDQLFRIRRERKVGVDGLRPATGGPYFGGCRVGRLL